MIVYDFMYMCYMIFCMHYLYVVKMKYEKLFTFESNFFLGPFTKEEEARILNTAVRVNKRNPHERKLGDMLNETRQILTEFYRSYNEKLAKLLQNDRFLWSD